MPAARAKPMPDQSASLIISNTPGVARLRILATSDLHSHITPWDYHADRASAAFGLARTASLIAAARAEVACCLLLDNGDFLQGSPMGDVQALISGQPDLHPVIAAMNALHYDAVTLGNHEFSNGLDFLMRHLAGAQFPVISANVVRGLGPSPLADQRLVPPTLLLRRDLTDARGQTAPATIGIIGFAPPQTTQWDRQQLAGSIATRDILQAAAAHVPQLRAQGADIVIALSHSGMGTGVAQAGAENASAALAALPGIDAVIAGHTHQSFPAPDFPATSAAIDPVLGMLQGKPAVMPGFHGSHLGIIDLYLTRQDGTWQVAGSHAELRPIARRTASGRLIALTTSDPGIMALTDRAHRATRAWARQPIARNPAALHSYFAMVSACSTVRLVAQAQASHVARALRDTPYADWPLVSAAAPFNAGGRAGPENYIFIAPGPLAMRHAFGIYPHPNTIAALAVTGADLSLWLERSFSQFRQVTPGAQDVELLDPDFTSANFDTLEPLTWEVDLTQPPRFDSRGKVINPQARRIRKLGYQGARVDPARRFVLATNSYRAAGSGGFAVATPDRIILSGAETNRDILLAHVTALGTLPAPGPANWRFADLPGTTVIFESAPAADAFASHFSPRRAEPLEIAATGFRRFRLHL